MQILIQQVWVCLRCYTSNKLPGGADAVGPWTTLWIVSVWTISRSLCPSNVEKDCREDSGKAVEKEVLKHRCSILFPPSFLHLYILSSPSVFLLMVKICKGWVPTWWTVGHGEEAWTRPGFTSQFCCLPAVWVQTSYLISPHLSILTYKMREVRVPQTLRGVLLLNEFMCYKTFKTVLI